MCTIIKILYCLFVLLMFVPISSGNGDVEISIRCDKELYLVDEPLWVDILVTNVGDTSVSVPIPKTDFGTLSFLVIANGTDTLAYCGGRSELLYVPTEELQPGDTLYALSDVASQYRYSFVKTPFGPNPVTGTIAFNAWYSGLESNQLTVEIVEPHGDEESAWRLLLQAKRERPSAKIAAKKLEDLVSRYPNSVYAPTAYELLSAMYAGRLADRAKYLKYNALLVQNHPASGYNLLALSGYLRAHEGRTREEAKLDSVMAEDIPFRLRMIARNMKHGFRMY